MTEKIIQATRDWFFRRNQGWVARDYESLYTIHGIQPVVAEMDRRYQLFSKRNAVDKKTITDVQLRMKPVTDEKNVQYEIIARESIRFVYELRGVLEHEQRVIDHVLIWQTEDITPRLVAHRHRAEWSSSHVKDRHERTDLWSDMQRSKRPPAPYQRMLAYRYAELWWDRTNPDYLAFAEDCTNFVSQVLRAGNVPMHFTGKRESGWWFHHEDKVNWSYSWAVSHSLVHFLRNSSQFVHADVVDDPRQLQIGDLIGYDWDGSGMYHHMAVVTAFDGNGDPLVNAHTVNSRMRHYSYEDSHAWTERTRYLFLHLNE